MALTIRIDCSKDAIVLMVVLAVAAAARPPMILATAVLAVKADFLMRSVAWVNCLAPRMAPRESIPRAKVLSVIAMFLSSLPLFHGLLVYTLDHERIKPQHDVDCLVTQFEIFYLARYEIVYL
jgi:hypothetical protein